MRMIKNIMITVILTSVSLGSIAAEKVGIITTTSDSLTSLEDAISAMAKNSGATSYKIIEAGGNNKLHGTAILYK